MAHDLGIGSVWINQLTDTYDDKGVRAVLSGSAYRKITRSVDVRHWVTLLRKEKRTVRIWVPLYTHKNMPVPQKGAGFFCKTKKDRDRHEE